MSFVATVGNQAIRPNVFLYPLRVWVVMAVLAIVNGGFREVVLIPCIGEYVGHVLSTALLVGAILVVSFVYFRGISIAYTQANWFSSASCGRC